MATVVDDEPRGALARNQAVRRRRVLDATLRLAAERGFEGLQMRDVAAEAQVALGTVYRYFASKERLLLEAMAEQIDDLRRYLEAHPDPGAQPAERVTRILGRANANLARHPDLTAAMVRAFGACREENAPVVVRLSASMERIITGAIGRAGPGDRRIARILVQVWMSSLIGWVGGVDPPDRVDDDLGAAVHLLLGP